MTIVYDLLGLQSKEHGERGIARYVLHLALAIEELDPGAIDMYLVRDYLPLPGVMEPLIRSGKVRMTCEVEQDPPSAGVFVVASPYELGENLDSILPTWARRPGWKRAGILYDLIPMIYPEIYLSDLWTKRYRARTQTVAKLDHLFSISEASKQDAVRLLGRSADSITMIAAGADERFQPPVLPRPSIVEELRRRIPELRPSYLLFPSGIEWRKNLMRMFDAYAALPPALRAAHQLVMICRTNEHERAMLQHETSARGIENDFLATGFVDDADLVRLYQAADLVIFPSLYEGFGLPVLEARRCGAPAVCSDSSSLKEVQPDPSARFDPTDVREMAAVLERTLGNPAELERLRTAEIPPFSWEWGARRALPVLARLEAAVQSSARTRKRLAVVTPLPPQKSGIATYAYRLLAPLAAEVDITVLVDAEPESVAAPRGVSVRPLRQWQALERLGGRFDEVLYFMGNSHFHVEALEMLRHRPGVVLMHDARMTGLYEMQFEMARDRLPDGTVGGFLRYWYPLKYREALYHEEVLLAPQADRFGILLTREIADHATRLLTHSRFATDLIRLDSARSSDVVFPIPVQPSSNPDGLRSAAQRPPVVSTFGKVDPIKQPFLIIEAFGHVTRLLPDARLRFIGDIDDQQSAAIQEAIDAAGVAHAVDITGHLSDEDYDTALAETAVAVQLRAFTNGESSAAVADLIGAGVPVVVSKLGAMAELPTDVVTFVDQLCRSSELGQVLFELLSDVERRDSTVKRGLAYAEEHSYQRAAGRLAETLFAPPAVRDRTEDGAPR